MLRVTGLNASFGKPVANVIPTATSRNGVATNSESTRVPLAGGHPGNPDIGGRADSVDQLATVMLDVADIDELVLQLGHAIPTEATLGAVEIQRVHCVIHHPIAELPILEHLRLRVRLTCDAPSPRCFSHSLNAASSG